MQVPCPHCHKSLNVPDHLAGKKIRCTGCKGVVQVPAAASAAAPANPLDFGGGSGPSGSSGPVSDFSFEAPTQQMNVGLKLRMQSAANLMLYSLGFSLFVGLLLMITPIIVTVQHMNAQHEGDAAAMATALGAAWGPLCCFYSTGFIAAIFIYLGARAMRLIRSRGMVMMGALFCLVLALEGIGAVVVCVVAAVSGARPILIASGLVGVFAFLQILFCSWAGLRAFLLASRAEVIEAIRAEAEHKARTQGS